MTNRDCLGEAGADSVPVFCEDWKKIQDANKTLTNPWYNKGEIKIMEDYPCLKYWLWKMTEI